MIIIYQFNTILCSNNKQCLQMEHFRHSLGKSRHYSKIRYTHKFSILFIKYIMQQIDEIYSN